MNALTRALEGISLVWWPTLLQHLPAPEVDAYSEEDLADDTDSFTTTLHNLAAALRLAEIGDLEELTLP